MPADHSEFQTLRFCLVMFVVMIPTKLSRSPRPLLATSLSNSVQDGPITEGLMHALSIYRDGVDVLKEYVEGTKCPGEPGYVSLGWDRHNSAFCPSSHIVPYFRARSVFL